MKVLVGMIVYDRIETVNWWMNAWTKAEKYGNAEIVVVHNYDGDAPKPDQHDNIVKWRPTWYWPRPNVGQDIAAFRDVIKADNFGDWDVLVWATDDNIPMRKDFIKAFVQPFESNPNMGLVGNQWVDKKYYRWTKPSVPDHFRTTFFAISRAAATGLKFPDPLVTKGHCYAFEWADHQNNMTEQIRRMGYDSMPVCGDRSVCWLKTNDYGWDTGTLHPRSRNPNMRKSFWPAYSAEFGEKL